MSGGGGVSQASFLNKFARVSSNSQEWSRLEYFLQISLGSSTAVIKNIWSIANPNMTMNFEKKNKGLLTLESWLETSLLDENNRPEKVCNKGFDFPPQGLLFPTGHITLNQGVYQGKSRIYELFFLKVACGRSYCVSLKSGNMIKNKKNLPYGFDSVYIMRSEDEEDSKLYKHDYILFDNTQVLPVYIVQFEFDTAKEEALTIPVCDNCQESPANVYCTNDDVGLCYDCDEEQHQRSGKLANKHKRIPISERPKQFGICPQHSEYKLEFFCSVCNQPICVYCKINGSHSTGDHANHPLVKISDAYQKALAESNQIDPLLEKRKNQLTDLLSQIDSKIKEINQNAAQVEEKIYQSLQEALKMLQDETQKKMSFLIGDQLEIKRQYEQIQWLQSFLKYQQGILTPADYLNSWSRHQRMRSEIINLSNVPAITNVQADMRVEGRVAVLSDSKLRAMNDDSYNTEKNLINFAEGEAGIVGSSKFRSNIFGKHNLAENSQSVLKSIASGNLVKNNVPTKMGKNLNYEENKDLDGNQSQAPWTSGGGRPDQFGTAGKDSGANFASMEKVMRSRNDVSPFGNDDDRNFNMGIQNSTHSLSKDANIKVAALKKQMLENQVSQLLSKAFKNSRILEGDELRTLYLNLPMNLSAPPGPELIYSSYGESITRIELQKKFNDQPYPNIILMTNKDEKFGGYASHPWNTEKAKFFGDANCFLFNLKKDHKLLPNLSPSRNCVFQWQNSGEFSFGKNDLSILDNFQECRSEVENDYLTGMNLKKDEAKTFLAGENTFVPGAIEIWAIIPHV